MHRPQRTYTWRSLLVFAPLGITLVLTQAGCPGGADLENADSWAGRIVGPGTGSGATGSGGTASGGTAGGGFDVNTVDCGGITPSTALSNECKLCHNGVSLTSAGLDLTPDANLAKRLKDVPATHGDISCGTDLGQTCVPDACPMGNTLLVDSSNPDASWMLKKINDAAGCGDNMPQGTWKSQNDKACIENIIRAIAASP